MLAQKSNSVNGPELDDVALQLRGVSKSFASNGRVVQALASIDLDVRAGEFVCLLGASGCGKSTLLSLIAGLEHATQGTIISKGSEVTGTGPDRVLLFQEAALFPWLTVQANVEFGLRQAGVPGAKRAGIAQQWIERVHLTGFEHAYTHQLSGGMRQRVALARSLAIDPAVLLMDEPFGALDALTRDRLHAELESLWAATHKTILFVTHNVREAVALGDRVLVFSPRPGRIVGEFQISLPRPRSLEDAAVIGQTAKIMSLLRHTLSQSQVQ
jgi:NitT/TauT family transport system ATP-binding protein